MKLYSFVRRSNVLGVGFIIISLVPPNANNGHSLGSLNFGIQENIEAFPVGTHPLVPMKYIAVFRFPHSKSRFSVFPLSL